MSHLHFMDMGANDIIFFLSMFSFWSNWLLTRVLILGGFLLLSFFFFGKLKFTSLKFGGDWILHSEISEFGFYLLKIGCLDFTL